MAVVDEAPRDFAPIADPVGTWLAGQTKNVEGERIVIEVPPGSVASEGFRKAAAEGWLADAELLKVAKLYQRSRKRGRKKELATLEKIEAIARLSMWTPRLKQRDMAKLFEQDYGDFHQFCKEHRGDIELAKSRLGSVNPALWPNPPILTHSLPGYKPAK